MGKGHLCVLFSALFLILVSLGLIVTSIVTDYWYEVDGSSSTNATVVRSFSYSLGMWRKCYKNGIPIDAPAQDRQGDCVFTYKALTKRAEDDMPASDYRYLSLERSWLALMITAAGLELFTILTLICGLWPGECRTFKRSTLYLVAALMSLLASMAGIASGICFIALRDLDHTSRDTFPAKVDTAYGWSFILAWIGTGLALVEGFMFLCLLRMDYDDVGESGKYQTM